MLDPENEPRLPAELEQVIFETTAHIRPLSIPTLMLIAWRVKKWVEPLLYQTIVVSDSGADADAKNLEGHRKPFRCRTIYRVVQQSKSFPGNSEAVPKVLLTACRSVENLWLSTAGPTTLFHLVEDLPLKRLYCDLRYLFGIQRQIDFSHRLFTQITHLEVFGGLLSGPEERWKQLAHIPHLTHLSFSHEYSVAGFLTILRTCTLLRVLIVRESSNWICTAIERSPDGAEIIRDPRFVKLGRREPELDWRRGAWHGGRDYWAHAEECVCIAETETLQYAFEEDGF
ncbi:hypothetical protein B0H14DRAFT_2990824 [Mycena olivaceomarginata]|nr:hypothetical protein B0H14DRAFT_2990824 [Mycena olivaceomarginata]